MKRILVLGIAAGSWCVAPASSAYGLAVPSAGNISLFGSYMSQEGTTSRSPAGGGGGAQLGISLTPMFFIAGSYQYNYLSQSDGDGAAFGMTPGPLSYSEKQQDIRGGGGLVFHLPATPVDLFGKAEYVHRDYQLVHMSGTGVVTPTGSRHNDDGIGWHGGAQIRLPGLSVYGSVGYLDLSRSSGPEFNLGGELPLAPLTWVFVEYRYDNFTTHDFGVSDHLQSNDVRAGVRMVF
jgi:hypothetical protein